MANPPSEKKAAKKPVGKKPQKEAKAGTSGVFKCFVFVVSIVVAFIAITSVIAPDFHILPQGNAPGTLTLMNKAVARDKVQAEFEGYDEAFQEGHESEKDQTMVNAYYNMATDFYEYGWGQSFHFAHTWENETHEDSILRHEYRLADEMQVKKGQRVLDCGCGVGGPARGIASYTGAHVTGITLNAYQVQRGRHHNKQQGLEHLVTLEQGDFTKIAYEGSTFDAVYAIEATCHAPRLADAYGEIWRVLKPGGYFATYEWIVTADYDPNNAEHVQINKEIEYGNGLPPLRNSADVYAAAAEVGFSVLTDIDLAQDTDATRPWYHKLDVGYWSHRFTHLSCQIFEFFGFAPKGTTDISSMLLTAAKGLVNGGKANTFTPMHLFVFQKPE